MLFKNPYTQIKDASELAQNHHIYMIDYTFTKFKQFFQQ